jgi:hypothetical protein
LDAGRTDALLQEAGVIDDQHGVAVPEVFHDVLTHIVQVLVGVPLDPVQQPMDTIRSRMTCLFGKCPAVLPLQRSNQPPHIRKGRLPRLRPAEPMHEPLLQPAQLISPQPDISKVPTHNQTNDPAGQQSRHRPLQY